MANKDARTCLMCKTSYSYCPRCGRDANKPSWMFVYHDENCMKIHKIMTDYAGDVIDKDTAKTMFEACDLTVVKEKFSEENKAYIDDIIGISKKNVKKHNNDNE